MKPNIDLLKRLRTRFLRMRHAAHFNMATIVEHDECGTAMCIAGHALDLEGYTHRQIRNRPGAFRWYGPNGKQIGDPLHRAAELIGMLDAVMLVSGTKYERNGLFYRYDFKTPKQAAKEIERLISVNVPE